MEESLLNLVELVDNSQLIDIKDEIRKKLFKTFDYCKFSKKLEREEINFFKKIQGLIDDIEFDKLVDIYIYLIDVKDKFNDFKRLVKKN